MAAIRTRSWSEAGAHDKTDSSEYNADTTSSSLLFYTLLPSLVQRRIPKMKSFKKALSDYDQRTRHTRALSQTSVTSITPPPSYQSTPEDRTSLDDHPGLFFRSGRNSEPPSRPSSSGTSTPTYLEETLSGVQWKYADPGFALLSLSSQEASTLSRSSHLVRRQYIDGVACVLRGLPSDLTLEEELSLREALPSTLQPTDLADSQLTIRHTPRNELTQPSSEPSTLHRSVATATFYLFLAISFLSPYIQLLLHSAYTFDRKHQISSRVLAQSVVAADVVGRQTLVLAKEVCGWNEGKVGEAVKEVGVYVVQGVSGGVYCGLGEGMQSVGKRREDGERRGRVEREEMGWRGSR